MTTQCSIESARALKAGWKAEHKHIGAPHLQILRSSDPQTFTPSAHLQQTCAPHTIFFPALLGLEIHTFGSGAPNWPAGGPTLEPRDQTNPDLILIYFGIVFLFVSNCLISHLEQFHTIYREVNKEMKNKKIMYQ